MSDAGVSVPATPRDQIIVWLLEGQRDSDIKEAIASRWPGMAANALLTSAVDHFATAASCDRRIVIGWALEAYRDIYRRMIDIGDFANAIKAVKELVALATTHNVYADDDAKTTDETEVIE
jgi:hypothetical protein